MIADWTALGAAIIGGTCGSFAARAFARRFGIVSHPNPIVPQHVAATAYLGGVGVLTGIAAGVSAAGLQGEQWPSASITVPALLYCLLGLMDDLRPLPPLRKFIAQAAIAILAVGLGLRLPLQGVDAVDAALAAAWIVTCVNAFNLTDVCDGLVSGLSATFFLGWLLWWPHSTLAVATFGACLAFLAFNAPRASMFLGDAGSHLLGFLAAAVTLQAPVHGPLLIGVLPLLLFVPLFELVFLTLVRMRKGIPWYKGSPDHFALRLQSAGWSRWTVDVAAWMTMAGAFAFAVAFERGGSLQRGIIVLAVALFSGFLVRYLLRHEVVRRG